jgi:hypothetical protein
VIDCRLQEWLLASWTRFSDEHNLAVAVVTPLLEFSPEPAFAFVLVSHNPISSFARCVSPVTASTIDVAG